MNAIILSALWGVVMMIGGVFFKKSTTPKYWAIAGILIILAANILEFLGYPFFNVDTKGMLRFDSFGLVFNSIAFICTLLLFLLNGKDFEKIGQHVSEYFCLMFFVLCGVSILSSFNTLLLLFLGIEILSIPLYILTGSDKRNLKGNEASLKYFLMGAFSTGLMLMGIALIYGGNSLGSFYIDAINLGEGNLSVMLAAGLVLLMVSMAFKVSAAPFHFWGPDAYDGAPSVVTSFMMTVAKVAAFIAFFRLFSTSFGKIQEQWQTLIVIITAATLLIGNVTAVFQISVKRMLAYSSISHAGFMMFALFALNDIAKEGLLLYAAAYSLATIGIFAVVISLSDYSIEGFNGLGKKQPLLAFAAVIFLLSLTGIPLTAGFTAKFYVLMAAVKNGHHLWLVIFAVICAAISAIYYFKVIQAMYFKEPVAGINENIRISSSYGWLLLLTAALIVLLGIMPGLVVDWLYF
ncbi:NADH-quinone oxidoreductase subunit N [Hanamia caeni]|jgi:NADH-quinone oxidoreductase subunit N|uniref:NADH-quinone oxidoreductase subunit N n=1 Tax=Hanamia caeni TaxID=2294116 RepID=A0A3M9NHK9_9BACT|nr:NADH-quinone oxidoreductase subunit N [Hanamia caeni]RNI36945.1 NADH-quinone oxidoreductase subunit N [Hanamia caeni]